MTRVGIERTESHLYYWNEEGPFPGVTTVQGILDKPALTAWAKKQVGECAMRNAVMIQAAVQSQNPYLIEETRKYLSKFPDRETTKAAELGTAVHYYAEQIGRGESPDVPEDAKPMIAQYRNWRDEWHPEYLAVEYQGINLTHRYGGTGDLIVHSHGETWLLDIKTGSYWPETALQLVACSEFEFIGYAGDAIRYPVPRVDRFGVLDLKPNGWKIVPYDINREATFEAFCHMAAIWHWKRTSGDVRGRAIEGSAT